MSALGTVASSPRECWCEHCDRAYPVWFAPNELWNSVVRDAGEGEPFLCPTCFALLAEERGVKVTAWVLRPETPDDWPATPPIHSLPTPDCTQIMDVLPLNPRG